MRNAAARGIVTFSPVREKVTKERTFVRIELPRERRIKGDGQEAATDAHSSVGIELLFAQMWWCESRFAALCIFAHGIVREGGIALRNGLKRGFSSWNQYPTAKLWIRFRLMFVSPNFYIAELLRSRNSDGNQPFGRGSSSEFHEEQRSLYSI